MRRLHDRRVHRRNGPKNSRGNGSNGTNGAAVGVEADLGADDDADSDTDAVVVRTKQFAVKPMHVEEAALQMELLDHDFFLFTSTETGRAAVLYRRQDGNLGLIEAAG